MQVAKAGPARASLLAKSGASTAADRSESYAPLYLSSSLGSLSFDIEDLQDLALRRLRLLKATIPPTSTGAPVPHPNPLNDPIRLAEREHGFHIPPAGNPGREDAILRDEAAHFLVRLALCKLQEERQWVLQRECALFASRIAATGADFALEKISATNGPTIRPVTAENLAEQGLREDLEMVARGARRVAPGEEERHYMVDFEHVPALVRSRRVLVRAGVAYVPEWNVRDIVVAQFRAKLNHGLLTASKAVGLAEQDRRMSQILTAIREAHVAEEGNRMKFDGDRDTDCISLDELKDSLPAMPLCQLHLMNRLSEDHHLRHSGRMQLGVFLKGCGLSMDESLRFWKTEFMKGGMAADKWEKNYAYNIRHHYGKEGKRRNLTPFNCMSVINVRPSPGEHHGCPYREFNHNRLSGVLRSIGADGDAVNKIIGQARSNNFQGACGLCFAATQPGEHEMTDAGTPVFFPSHPNEYFLEARRRRLGKVPGSQGTEQGDVDMNDADMPLAHTAVETPEKDKDADDGSVDKTPAPKRARFDTSAGGEVARAEASGSPSHSPTAKDKETTDANTSEGANEGHRSN